MIDGATAPNPTSLWGSGGPDCLSRTRGFLWASPVDGHQASRHGVVPEKPRFQEHDKLELPPTVYLMESSQVELADLGCPLD